MGRWPSKNRAGLSFARQQQAGYVTAQPYLPRHLSHQHTGREPAATCKSRHEIVVKFLHSLGIPKRVAELDAEGMEHHTSPETLAAMTRWIEKQRAKANRSSG
jgi:DtxR family manganese transport transcriptional regulator